MIEDFFDGKCDIYHIAEKQQSPGYNLPTSAEFSYPDTPDICGQPCHFGVKSLSVTISQQQPMMKMDARIKLTLPAGTDIRLNDKVINVKTGLEYTVELPMDIHGHHIFAYIKKAERQKAL